MPTDTSADATTSGSDEQDSRSSEAKAADDPRSGYPAVLTTAELAAILRLDRRTVLHMLRIGAVPGARLLRRRQVAGSYA